MAVLDIVHYGDPILRKPCSPVIDFSQMDALLEDMFDSMYEAEGIGLAANQVGLDMNLFTIDTLTPRKQRKPMYSSTVKLLLPMEMKRCSWKDVFPFRAFHWMWPGQER